MDWMIREEGYDVSKAPALGNRYLIGNGCLGVRGTLEEYGKEQLPAINLAGIYDRVGNGWREPVNVPNLLFTYLRVDGEDYRLPEKNPISHGVALDYRHGIFKRHTTWRTERGNITFTTERFASMQQVNVIGMRMCISADFHADVEVVTGIDGDVWELNGPHLDQLVMEQQGGELLVRCVTHEQRIPIAVAESVVTTYPMEMKYKKDKKGIFHRICVITKPGEVCCIEKWGAVVTGKDCADPAEKALEYVRRHKEKGYQVALTAHEKCWENLWKHSEVVIKGDNVAMEAVNYSLYHLHCIAPRHAHSLSIPARGLSGQTYKGAVFWDTEMFMLDFFLMTDPDTARTLMKYRIDTLEGALKKAAHYGYEGAFYAWESQEGGYDACTDYNVTDVFTGRPVRTYFKDKQVHISAAVAYGILRYVEWTGDTGILDEQGVRTIVECARFYYSMLLHRLTKDCYEIHDVIGPDEYHERVNNNGYTNRMAKYTMEQAAVLLEKAADNGSLPPEYARNDKWKELSAQFKEAAEKLYLPAPGSCDGYPNIIEQFDGYFDMEDVSLEEVRGRLLHEKEYWGGANGVASHTRIIKQADVVTWLNLFSGEYSQEVLKANWEYYEPRTEHGSSLSAGMYAMLACKIGEPDKAYPFFLKSAEADLKEGGKEWAGLVYIGGTHPAAAGAAYMTAVEGFAGVRLQDGELVCEPHLPSSIKAMQFHVFYQGNEYEINIEGKEKNVKLL